ncbi:MAG: signal peptidase [Planctomycetaceae bacterium]|nr:signal peptidase [Planctomycetaceae bacterium]
MAKYITRYGAMRLLGVFTYPDNLPLLHGFDIIAQTNRGQECGVVLCDATAETLARLNTELTEGRIVRQMSEEDKLQQRQLREVEKDEFVRCRNIIEKMNLVMDLVRVEHIFGGERLIVYYTADGRVDFRELVKTLASEFQTRIEMRQIGVRDETKLLADFGDCGKEVCCNWYLVEMPPVSMKMAKLQKATLDPAKISGRCGRLKCCLRYEYDHYAESLRQMPLAGKIVSTPEGEGKVIGHELLAGLVAVEIPDAGKKSIPLRDVVLLNTEGGAVKEKPAKKQERKK